MDPTLDTEVWEWSEPLVVVVEHIGSLEHTLGPEVEDNWVVLG